MDTQWDIWLRLYRQINGWMDISYTDIDRQTEIQLRQSTTSRDSVAAQLLLANRLSDLLRVIHISLNHICKFVKKCIRFCGWTSIHVYVQLTATSQANIYNLYFIRSAATIYYILSLVILVSACVCECVCVLQC